VVNVNGPAATAGTSGADPADGRRAPRAASWHPGVGWALMFAAVTTVGLALLAWGLLIAHALTYGSAEVLRSGSVAPPDEARYRLALLLAVVVNLASASALAGLARHTPARTWRPSLQGLSAAVLAAVAAGCTLLLTLGIDPVHFVTA